MIRSVDGGGPVDLYRPLGYLNSEKRQEKFLLEVIFSLLRESPTEMSRSLECAGITQNPNALL